MQQKSVRDIRAAIKPTARPTHHIYGHLPQKFGDGASPSPKEHGNTIVYQDGTRKIRIPIGNDEDPVVIDVPINSADKGSSRNGPGDIRSKGESQNTEDVENEGQSEEQSMLDADTGSQVPIGIIDERFVIPESEQQSASSKPQRKLENENEAKKPLSRADRRKKIKEELMAFYEKDPKAYSPRMW